MATSSMQTSGTKVASSASKYERSVSLFLGTCRELLDGGPQILVFLCHAVRACHWHHNLLERPALQLVGQAGQRTADLQMRWPRCWSVLRQGRTRTTWKASVLGSELLLKSRTAAVAPGRSALCSSPSALGMSATFLQIGDGQHRGLTPTCLPACLVCYSFGPCSVRTGHSCRTSDRSPPSRRQSWHRQMAAPVHRPVHHHISGGVTSLKAPLTCGVETPHSATCTQSMGARSQ